MKTFLIVVAAVVVVAIVLMVLIIISAQIFRDNVCDYCIYNQECYKSEEDKNSIPKCMKENFINSNSQTI